MDAFTDTGRLLRFESFELDVRSRELRKGTDRIRLQEQPFEILRMMLERPGDVVTREELAKRLWPDGTFVDFEHSLNAAVKRLRAALGDDADNPRFRRDAAAARLPVHRGDGGKWRRDDARCAARLQGAARGAAVHEFQRGSRPGILQRRADRGNDPAARTARARAARRDCPSVVDGVQGRHARAREIGETLRADYLLEGSVRREGDRVRITAWLVETSSETHLWTDVYERHLTDCLSVQADVAARIAGNRSRWS